MTRLYWTFKRLENKLLCFLIRRINLNDMDPDVFEELIRKLFLTAVEAVVIREGPDGPEVLMTRRSLNDRHWPGALHIPGTFIKKWDSSYEKALRRLAQIELGVTDFSRTTKAGTLFYLDRKNQRGNNHGVIFLCELSETPTNGEFYPLKDFKKVHGEECPHTDWDIIQLALTVFGKTEV